MTGAARLLPETPLRNVIGYQSVHMLNRGLSIVLFAVTACAAELAPLPQFPKHESALRIVAPCVPRTPWTVAGEHGALFGDRKSVV